MEFCPARPGSTVFVAATSITSAVAARMGNMALVRTAAPWFMRSLGCAKATERIIVRPRGSHNTVQALQALTVRISLVGLFDSHYTVYINVADFLPGPARPANLDFLHAPVLSKSKVHTAIARRCVSDRGGYLVPLGVAILGGKADLCADCHAIALGAHQVQQDPMVVVTRDVVKQLNWPAQHGDHHVHAAVVVEISESYASMSSLQLEVCSSGGADILEFPVPEVSENRIWLGVPPVRIDKIDVVDHIRTGDKQVLPAVVVKVEDPISPSGHSSGSASQAAAGRHVEKIVSAAV